MRQHMPTSVTFEKIVGGCRALGYLNGRPVFASGPLPGETAAIEVTRERSGFAEAQVLEIINPSVARTEPMEDHYLSCSPWQNVDYSLQLQLKQACLQETFGQPGIVVPVEQIVGAQQLLGYRNKLEFSVAATDGDLSLAFHARGSYQKLHSLPDGCKLGSAALNQAALALAVAARESGLAGSLESIVVRQSVVNGKILGELVLTRPMKRDWLKLPIGELAGLVVSWVRGRGDHEVLWRCGEAQLVELLRGTQLAYGFDCFFQTNPAMFELALDAIAEAVPDGCRVVDLYGGVGSIGLSVSRRVASVTGMEIQLSSAAYANANADRNGILTYRSVALPAERMGPEVLNGADVVVVDPPRAGLHPHVVQDLIGATPTRIIYLSCNPATQARDIRLLAEHYRPSPVSGFDFYPGTLHIESLVVFDRI
jgi:23S rRNA (uracil1939-C5)-methyltransferase